MTQQELADEIADAQRVVASWSPEKRASVQLEGGIVGQQATQQSIDGVASPLSASDGAVTRNGGA